MVARGAMGHGVHPLSSSSSSPAGASSAYEDYRGGGGGGGGPGVGSRLLANNNENVEGRGGLGGRGDRSGGMISGGEVGIRDGGEGGSGGGSGGWGGQYMLPPMDATMYMDHPASPPLPASGPAWPFKPTPSPSRLHKERRAAAMAQAGGRGGGGKGGVSSPSSRSDAAASPPRSPLPTELTLVEVENNARAGGRGVGGGVGGIGVYGGGGGGAGAADWGRVRSPPQAYPRASIVDKKPPPPPPPSTPRAAGDSGARHGGGEKEKNTPHGGVGDGDNGVDGDAAGDDMTVPTSPPPHPRISMHTRGDPPAIAAAPAMHQWQPKKAAAIPLAAASAAVAAAQASTRQQGTPGVTPHSVQPRWVRLSAHETEAAVAVLSSRAEADRLRR